MPRVQLLRLSASLALCVVLLSAGCRYWAAPVGQGMLGQPAPAARLALIDGTVLPLESFRGKPVVLFFWGSWCRRSRALMPKIAQFSRRLERVAVITVNVDEEPNLRIVRDRLAQYVGTPWYAVFSGNGLYDEAYQAFSGEQVPFIVVLDRSGIIRAAGDSLETLAVAETAGALQ